MILFLGDSITWGQGLQIEKWISEGKSVDFCNKHSVPHYHGEHISYDDDMFRKSKHFPNLVAKELGVSYSTKWGNGGTNDETTFIIENLEKLIHPYTVQLVVIQFTDMVRDDLFSYVDNKNFGDLAELNLKNQIFRIDNTLSYPKNKDEIIPWIGISWHKEHSNFLKEKYPNNFVGFEYNNMKFDCLHDLYRWKNSLLREADRKSHKLEIKDIYNGIDDGHPSSFAHEIIAESVLKKIKREKIQFSKLWK